MREVSYVERCPNGKSDRFTKGTGVVMGEVS